MNPQTMKPDPRLRWKRAYRLARSLCLGTLHMSFPSPLAFAAVAASDHVRTAPILSARLFRAFGYYAKGCKRI